MLRRRGPVLGSAVALVLLVAGVVRFTTGRDAASFGWFAYAPVPDTVVLPWAVVWTRRQALGAGLVVLALLTASGLAGYGLGRRRSAGRP